MEGTLAVCEGGSGALGHPIEYIQLDRVVDNSVVLADTTGFQAEEQGVAICMYCGLRYRSKHHHNHDH